jgi:hypothetical protein
MNNASKLSILAAVLVAGAAAIVACTATVTTTSCKLDGQSCTTSADCCGLDSNCVQGLCVGVGDSGLPDANLPDTNQPPVDGGVDAPAVDAGKCGPVVAACPILAQVSFGTTTCNDCDLCVAQNCCTVSTTCFTPSSCPDGGTNCACENDCIAQCDATDGGAACTSACQLAYQFDAGSGMSPDQQWTAMSTCIQTNCAARCPGN